MATPCTWTWDFGLFCGADSVRYFMVTGKPEAFCTLHSTKACLAELLTLGDHEITEEEYSVCTIMHE